LVVATEGGGSVREVRRVEVLIVEGLEKIEAGDEGGDKGDEKKNDNEDPDKCFATGVRPIVAEPNDGAGDCGYEKYDDGKDGEGKVVVMVGEVIECELLVVPYIGWVDADVDCGGKEVEERSGIAS
jgi:hypothetical protein